ncbi:hypothetical protein M422DRAFT_276109 [Sphaerobolus stellatus SS14]|uniref:Uncharacterized protein n=1 Tax=Sphaerobolus stellatus (strain SS14) TaxID=990650 RepID=A0A0C9T389_SPHS4|nr:hypothetical protein M422DRAFT_276109 [Sphaerobolus stellatus SS14]
MFRSISIQEFSSERESNITQASSITEPSTPFSPVPPILSPIQPASGNDTAAGLRQLSLSSSGSFQLPRSPKKPSIFDRVDIGYNSHINWPFIEYGQLLECEEDPEADEEKERSPCRPRKRRRTSSPSLSSRDKPAYTETTSDHRPTADEERRNFEKNVLKNLESINSRLGEIIENLK